MYEKTKQAIVRLTDELEAPPCTHFELAVVNGSVKSFKPTAENMKLLQHYHQEVLFFLHLSLNVFQCFDTVDWVNRIGIPTGKGLCRLSSEVVFQNRWWKSIESEPADSGSHGKCSGRVSRGTSRPNFSHVVSVVQECRGGTSRPRFTW